jgi:hypothetical protein
LNGLLGEIHSAFAEVVSFSLQPARDVSARNISSETACVRVIRLVGRLIRKALSIRTGQRLDRTLAQDGNDSSQAAVNAVD